MTGHLVRLACVLSLTAWSARAACVDLPAQSTTFVDPVATEFQAARVIRLTYRETLPAVSATVYEGTQTFVNGLLTTSLSGAQGIREPSSSTRYAYQDRRLVRMVALRNRGEYITSWSLDAQGRRKEEVVVLQKGGATQEVSRLTCTYQGRSVTQLAYGKPYQGVRPVTLSRFTLDAASRLTLAEVYEESAPGATAPSKVLFQTLKVAYVADGSALLTTTLRPGAAAQTVRRLQLSTTGRILKMTEDDGTVVTFAYTSDRAGNWTEVQVQAVLDGTVVPVYRATRTLTYKP